MPQGPGESAALPAVITNALDQLVTLLPVDEVSWALTGSVAHRLLGVPVPLGGDIDVQTDGDGAYEVARRLGQNAIVDPVCLLESGRIRSHFGRARVAGVPVDIMGAVQKRASTSEPWGAPTDPADHRQLVSAPHPRTELRVPVLGLHYEATAYEQMGRPERAAVLRQAAWNARTSELLEESYLSASDPRGGSGFRGDAERWRRARRVIVEAIDRDGSFLDIGCANGLLMETIVEWAAHDDHAIEPFGLELLPAVTALARRRVPQWADRIFDGDVTTWRPPQRFHFARTELEHVPEEDRRRLVERCLDEFVAPGGRLIVCSYGSATRDRPKAEDVRGQLLAWGFDVAGHAEAADVNGVVITRIAWLERAD